MLLTETIAGADTRMKLVEEGPRQGEKGILGRVQGILSQYGVLNKNRRIYERSLWERVLKEYQPQIKAKTLLGEPDHPETRTESKIREGSHCITKMWLDESNNVWGEVAVFDNELGRSFWPMLQFGVQLGFSTRGDGDLTEADDNTSIVDAQTYEFSGVDFVLNPSFVKCMPTAMTEEAKTMVRSALTEAVSKQKITEETRQNIETILESGDKPRVPGMGALEAALNQLAAAKDLLLQREQDLLEESREKVSLHKAIAELESRENKLQARLHETIQQSKTLAESLQRAKQIARETRARAERVRGMTDQERHTLKENQNAHLRLVQRHKQLQEQHESLKKKYASSVAMMREMQSKMREDATRIKTAKAAMQESTRRHKEEAPKLVEAANLKAYKARRRLDVEIPADIEPLFEDAKSVEQVDTLIEMIQKTRAARYPGLPLGLNSRRDREEIMEAAIAGVKTEEDEEMDEEQQELQVTVEQQFQR